MDAEETGKWAIQDLNTPPIITEKQGIPQAGAVKCAVLPAHPHQTDEPGDFARAVQAIVGLPLSDGEKAEAIRRLLQGDRR